ncbi:MAG: hypothetical protein N0C84_01470 [Candidatus Thiodiazotropha taylori]|uniref:Uncharacterized protein n=1 Tax=Candidatus Thiodiazotropha taylori TaxID=2792791 RepID=A0A9E4K9N6_9GAMM|nr:hypothetical protein [Candidatus Thiodiazotropha taylori]MCG8091636.1 hypothetical protein [Candidatus Thiodiazotropha taylori]MCW4255117.1 hypothetical protein [Candidatus Thiodiazotropha taylori]MCW4277017.1 hypothetical protein [Candidatus Thiodiazotropha taylori]
MSRTFASALTLSIAMHFLLTWYLGDKLWRYMPEPPSYNRSSTIQITIESPVRVSTPLQNHQRVSMPKQPKTPIVEPKRPDTTDPPERNQQKQPIAESKTDRITSARILLSSKQISRNLVIGEQQADTKGDINSVSAILDQALNPKREAANISTLVDGTTRVVTEQGYTYCIKPLDDWRIVDPQDDMRVSAFCK